MYTIVGDEATRKHTTSVPVRKDRPSQTRQTVKEPEGI